MIPPKPTMIVCKKMEFDAQTYFILSNEIILYLLETKEKLVSLKFSGLLLDITQNYG